MFVCPNTRLTLSIGMPFDKAKVAQEWRSRSRAAGVDFGNDSYSGDGRWINVPTMASILKRMPHLKFIMTDCCNMMCLENLYELRSVCDYMLASMRTSRRWNGTPSPTNLEYILRYKTSAGF